MTTTTKKPRGPNQGTLIRYQAEIRALEAVLFALAPTVAERPDLQAAIANSLANELLRCLADWGPEYDLAIAPIFAHAESCAQHPTPPRTTF